MLLAAVWCKLNLSESDICDHNVLDRNCIRRPAAGVCPDHLYFASSGPHRADAGLGLASRDHRPRSPDVASDM